MAMKIRDLFASNVERDLPPVVYFHQQSPEKLKSEVDEYIITGGHLAGDPRARRVEGGGIHEQFVHLLSAIASELDKKDGVDFPSVWISGFYGSGKSSFAKLLGLSLDGAMLPDGTTLASALLGRDDSARAGELGEAWRRLSSKVDALSAVFDIGAVARDQEHIHAAALRQVQKRLGYCAKSHLVAQYELKLQKDGLWPRFLETAQQALGKSWDEAKREEMADDHFSHVLHVLQPERYLDPTSWVDSHQGSQSAQGTSADEVVESIETMLAFREQATRRRETLFLVIDEVSQYIHQDTDRMLKLQSFVSALGQRLKGRVWLLATSQQKLEDATEADAIGKLKGRFPPHLRVHLSPSNIRDVVHRRLLKKKHEAEPVLIDLFEKHRADLKLNAFGCEEITQDDFVEVYPLLPGHIDLLMQITSSLHSRRSRAQGDDHTIRGLLQLLGELFRRQKLADMDVGALVTLDAIYAIQGSALEADVQTALNRAFQDSRLAGDELCARVIKAVALLELVQEKLPTTAELVSQCLYARVGQGSSLDAVKQALERLRAFGHLAYSERQGYKIQSSAGQEWVKERDDFVPSVEEVGKIVRARLKQLVEGAKPPRFKERPFAWGALYSDGRAVSDERVIDPRTDTAVTVDYRFLRSKAERDPAEWVKQSGSPAFAERLVWVAGEIEPAEKVAKELYRAKKMVDRYQPRRDSLPEEKRRLLVQEQALLEDLEKRATDAVGEALFEGAVYFRGTPIRPADKGSTFALSLVATAEATLPAIYPNFTPIAVTPDDLKQLFEPTITGPLHKFLDDGLGILSMDAGKCVASCGGVAPRRVLEFIEQSVGVAQGTSRSSVEGGTIIGKFGKPPNGYPTDVVTACLLGLVRAGKISVRGEGEGEITSVRDPGIRELFGSDRKLRKAQFFLPAGGDLTPRERVAVCQFFKSWFLADIERDNDAIADAVFLHFPRCLDQLRAVEAQFSELPGRPGLPQAVSRLSQAIDVCRRSRQVKETTLSLRDNLDALRDGLTELRKLEGDLTRDKVDSVRRAHFACEGLHAQLQAIGAAAEIEARAAAVSRHVHAPRPWDGIKPLEKDVAEIEAHYRASRQALLNQQTLEAEQARARIKTRPGFERLGPDASHHVLRPLTEALFDTRPEATSPTLKELRDGFALRLPQAEQEANDRLDDELNKGNQPQVVGLAANLRGREIASRDELETLLRELEKRIGVLLEQGKRVRLM